MSYPELSTLIAQAGKLLELLHEEAVGLLKNFDTFTSDNFEEAIRRRDDIIEQLRNIEEIMAEGMVEGKLAELHAFKQSKEVIIKKILEIDSLVIALAKKQQSLIKDNLSALSKGKNALQAYGDSIESPYLRLNNIL